MTGGLMPRVRGIGARRVAARVRAMAEPLGRRLAVATRANVPPFHVMDLLAAADRRAGAATATCSTWWPASRRPRRPRPYAGGRRTPSTTTCSATRWRPGIPELREAIAAHHARFHGLDVSPDDVVVTTGSSGWLPAGVPGRVRGRRPGGDRAAGLPLLPQRPHRAGLRGGRAADRAGAPLPADGRRCSRRSTDRCRGWSSPARRTPPARCCSPSELAALASLVREPTGCS